MTDDRTDNQWRELSWRRKLTPAQRAELQGWLAAHPEAESEWAAEAALNGALGRLRDVPVPSNFTTRVLEVAQQETAAGWRSRPDRRWLAWPPRLSWLPKMAFAGIVVGASLFSYHGVLAYQRAQMAKSVATISDISSLPSPQILTNFEAIQALGRTPTADLELLQWLK